jgi:hypothetical protein
VPGEGRSDRAGVSRVGDVPQPDGAVVGAGGQGVPVRAVRHRVDGSGMAGEGLPDRAGVGRMGDVPQPDGLISAADRQGGGYLTNGVSGCWLAVAYLREEPPSGRVRDHD